MLYGNSVPYSYFRSPSGQPMACTCIALYEVPRDLKALHTTFSHPPIHIHILTVVSYIVATAAQGETDRSEPSLKDLLQPDSRGADNLKAAPPGSCICNKGPEYGPFCFHFPNFS
ncbi:hypothetical protein CHARACLAT_030217 [Characodon lateralis]|uniref:Uncharacterized protein n=1 Tax=Characodon lateralis TaxID=208331 RepID=A0ABU7DVL8_9TELE|nr:hypothetical protein [Characodon lateralis]